MGMITKIKEEIEHIKVRRVLNELKELGIFDELGMNIKKIRKLNLIYSDKGIIKINWVYKGKTQSVEILKNEYEYEISEENSDTIVKGNGELRIKERNDNTIVKFTLTDYKSDRGSIKAKFDKSPSLTESNDSIEQSSEINYAMTGVSKEFNVTEIEGGFWDKFVKYSQEISAEDFFAESSIVRRTLSKSMLKSFLKSQVIKDLTKFLKIVAAPITILKAMALPECKLRIEPTVLFPDVYYTDEVTKVKPGVYMNEQGAVIKLCDFGEIKVEGGDRTDGLFHTYSKEGHELPNTKLVLNKQGYVEIGEGEVDKGDLGEIEEQIA